MNVQGVFLFPLAHENVSLWTQKILKRSRNTGSKKGYPVKAVRARASNS